MILSSWLKIHHVSQSHSQLAPINTIYIYIHICMYDVYVYDVYVYDVSVYDVYMYQINSAKKLKIHPNFPITNHDGVETLVLPLVLH